MADTVYKILCNGADVQVGPGMLGTILFYLCMFAICVIFNYRTSMDLCYV